MSDVRIILENLGYKLVNDGNKYYRTKPLYRDSGNHTSLRISKKSGWFTDYSAGITGPLPDLVKLTLNLKSLEEAKSWLANNEFDLTYSSETAAPIIEDAAKYYPNELLDKLVKNHDYWVNRNIPKEVIEQFGGGLVIGDSSLKNRYVIPIFDSNDKILGFAGRDITGKSANKWKIIGPKRNFIFPIQNIQNIASKKEVILVESIGDCLALARAGISNSLVLFGVTLSDKLISKLVGLNPRRIIIALNNDTDNGQVGQNNAFKITDRLSSFFDSSIITIAIPSQAKDFGEMTNDQIYEWYKQAIPSNRSDRYKSWFGI